VKLYPQSIVMMDALEQAMAAYQGAGNASKVEDLAKHILQLTPDNMRALAIVTALDRAKAAGGDKAALKETCTSAQTGLQQLPTWQRPEGITDSDFEKLRNQMADIFYGASGFCALQNKEFTKARAFYEKTFQIDPTNLQDVYQLAVAGLEMNPIDVNGLWYCGKAIHLAQQLNNTQAVNGMTTYCKLKYRKYHGGEDGWDQALAVAATENALPTDFASHIKPAPTPCDLAVQAVQENDPAMLSFSDLEFILSKVNCSPANKAAADKVWAAIQAKQKNGEARLKIQVKVISSTNDSLDAAITDENQQANKADVHVVLEEPVVSPPAPGAMTDVIGMLTKYTSDPFTFTMEKGELAAPKPPAHALPAH
jgi:tetratricopeptide (TPR) repeat protein